MKNQKTVKLGRAEGYLHAQHRPYRGDDKRLYVEDIKAEEAEEFQVRKDMIDCLLKTTRDRHYDRVYLTVDASDLRLCGFYEDIGFYKERIQFMRRLKDDDWPKKNLSGTVLTADAKDLLKYRTQFTRLYLYNVKAHEYEEEFGIIEAEKKIDELKKYLSSGRALLYYTLSRQEVSSFMWVHPIIYTGTKRIYIHAFATNPCCENKGCASMLYDHLLNQSFDAEAIYTHVDASNAASCHIQRKYGFVPEEIQYCITITKQ